MPNRSIPPIIEPLDRIAFPEHTEMLLNDKIPCVLLQSGTSDVVKVEFIFNAGRIYESKKITAKSTNLLLKSGTKTRSSEEINQAIDFYGATVGLPINFDYSGVVLYCLSKFAKDLLPVVFDIIVNPSFPQKELEIFRRQQQSKLRVALESVDTMAFRTITEAVFGSEHPYGYNTEIGDYEDLSRSDLLDHHQRLYTSDNCKIFISGNLLPDARRVLDRELEKIPSGHLAQKLPFPPISRSPESIRVPMSNKVQVALKIGRRLFNRSHPDYQKTYLLSVLLGGYFGSRLSMKIREEKGYTYGIHSSIDTMVHDGIFLISTEVDPEYSKATLDAIYLELEDLINNDVSEEELFQMKSYLQGYLLNSVDGVFRSSNLIRSLQESGVGASYFESFQDVLKNITPQEIREMASKYLQRKDLWEVVVG